MTAISDIEDYAVIGDSRTAALVSNQGSIDWLCLPQFDSPALFNRLLDYQHGGHFSIRPVRPFSVHRFYEDTTAVLITEFRTDEGMVRLTDLFPVLPEARKRTHLYPLRSVLRYIEGIEGTVELEIIFKPKLDYGRRIPAFHMRGTAGYFADLGNRLLHLATDIRLDVKHGELEGRVTVTSGRQYVLWLAYSEDAPAMYPVLAKAESAIQETFGFWMRWAETCTYHGPYRREVVRSALTLKLLSFAPSGAIVAAPTTSLPEVIGGVRNWDYRYCWLRDASYTAGLFFRIGFPTEAIAFVQWLVHATALTYPELQVLYDVYGEASLSQADLRFLDGYRKSQPVRIGNQAHAQFQLDVYGEVLDSLLLYVEAGNEFDKGMCRRLVRMADFVSSQWAVPDHGIWEIPNGRQYVHSKVMCWVALDRAERIVCKLGIRADVGVWEQTRESIRQAVFETGYSRELQSFVQTLGSAEVDATALTFVQTGFIKPDDSRFISTVQAIRQILTRGDLVYRYRSNDGLDGDEGAFLPCSFWLVEALAMIGQRDEAVLLFERLQKRANDVGLYSEEMDVSTGMMLGNFPQALTHLAHIGAALRLNHGR